MHTRRIGSEALLGTLRQRLVMVKEEMLAVAKCSPMTLWRILRGYGYLTSFNANGRYYTLHDIPTFDTDGLWFHGPIGFSEYGSLPRTASEMIARSATGFTCRELRERLGVNVGPTLRKLLRTGALCREKHRGVFVYLSASEPERRGQLERRCRQVGGQLLRRSSPTVAIAVLVELVQRVELSPAQVCTRLAERGLGVSEHEVRAVFEDYDLEGRAEKGGLSNC
jgi:hypothetical protein